MRPQPTEASSSATTFWHWNSPLPYLFIGLGLMILFISAALIILACSFRRRRHPQGGEKAVQPSAVVAVADDTPKIVVIMPGDDNPTCLAIPTPTLAQVCVCKD
ncbi:hypothetical protein ACS0TY_028563 [Phlomoides rotata]